MIGALRLGLLAALIVVSGVAASVPTSSAPPGGDAYPNCDAPRLTGADLTALKRAIVKSAQLINSPEVADRFFDANQIIVTPAKLRKGRRDFIAYVRGPSYCGTSGCPAIVIEELRGPAGLRYRAVTRILPARLPISTLSTVHDGARDIGVAVEGGGIRSGYTGALVFDGGSYANNPTLPGVRHVKPNQSDVVLGAPGASTRQCQLH